MINSWAILKKHHDLILILLDTLHKLANDQSFINEFGNRMSRSSSYDALTKNQARFGLFNESSFMIANSINNTQLNMPMFLISSIFDELKKSKILHKYLIGYDLLCLNKDLFNFFWEREWLTNIIYGVSYLPIKYQQSVFKICVQNQDGLDNSGTGFLLKFKKTDGSIIGMVVSNKHVLENKLISICTNGGKFYNARKVILDPENDIGTILLYNKEIVENPCFHLLDDYHFGEDTVTLGYPHIPFTYESSLIIHKGEYNGNVTTLMKKNRLLYSAKTGPGNSGGPLVTTYGGVIGLIEESLFDQEKYVSKGVQPYNIAIPVEDIKNFINTNVLLDCNYEA